MKQISPETEKDPQNLLSKLIALTNEVNSPEFSKLDQREINQMLTALDKGIAEAFDQGIDFSNNPNVLHSWLRQRYAEVVQAKSGKKQNPDLIRIMENEYIEAKKRAIEHGADPSIVENPHF
jgi:hypothetical protein